ncbi:MAG TPA: hypothetical protein VLG09_03600 [Candidatus Saccharimonadales bacterium]|nr:hypothetical protein [Candidatus Saccharimonadales bacterium]
MPYKNPADAKRWYQRYYAANRERYKVRSTLWRANNQEKWVAYKKEYDKLHPEVNRLGHKRYYDKPEKKELKRLYDQQYKKANRARIRDVERKYREANRDKVNAWYTSTYRTNINYQISRKLRARLYKKIQSKGIRKSKNSMALTGCDAEFLRGYLEGQFTPGMTWENIHIDHHIPCDAFDLTDPKQQEQCFHYSNLKPLLGPENLKKGKKMPILKDAE